MFTIAAGMGMPGRRESWGAEGCWKPLLIIHRGGFHAHLHLGLVRLSQPPTIEVLLSCTDYGRCAVAPRV